MMTSHLPEPHYRLRCTGCGRIHRDDDLSMRLSCDAHHPPAHLRSEYRRARFRPIEARPGLFRYADWLPVRLHHPGSPRPAAFNAERLAAALGGDADYADAIAVAGRIAALPGFFPEGGAARAARELPNVPTVPDLFVAPSDLQSIPERVARLAERRAA